MYTKKNTSSRKKPPEAHDSVKKQNFKLKRQMGVRLFIPTITVIDIAYYILYYLFSTFFLN